MLPLRINVAFHYSCESLNSSKLSYLFVYINHGILSHVRASSHQGGISLQAFDELFLFVYMYGIFAILPRLGSKPKVIVK